MTAAAFGFTKLLVDDLAVAERFYCETFGMVRVREVSSDEHKFALDEVILTLPGGGHALVLTCYRKRPCPPAGAAWTGFVVDDLAATLAQVERYGGVIEVPIHANDDHGVLAAIAADPNGHLIEIVQMVERPSG